MKAIGILTHFDQADKLRTQEEFLGRNHFFQEIPLILFHV